MRVTEGMRYAEVVRNLAKLQTQHADATRQAMTGVRLDRPSRDPSASAEVARLRASLSSHAAHKEAIGLVKGDAELAESVLAQATELVNRAKELTMSGANDTLSADDRRVMATEIRGLKDELIRLGNTRGTKGYIFAGSKTDSPAFDGNGAFQGNDVMQSVDIGSSAPVQVGASGARAFTAAGGRDIFTDLDALASALENNDVDAIAASLDTLDASHEQITQERGRVGLLVGRLDTSAAVLEQLELSDGKRQETVGTVDPLEAYSRVNELGGAIERSIAVSRRIFDLTGTARF